jgi:hypothetical protein
MAVGRIKTGSALRGFAIVPLEKVRNTEILQCPIVESHFMYLYL